jgi:predicted Zn-ribbon and HTH transcriptional regulator
MIDKCPGSDLRYISIETTKCSKCGYDVEMFSDEHRRICPKCKKEVNKEMKNACFLYCKFYDKCKVIERSEE